MKYFLYYGYYYRENPDGSWQYLSTKQACEEKMGSVTIVRDPAKVPEIHGKSPIPTYHLEQVIEMADKEIKRLDAQET